jgi:hypothetical protein
MARNVMHLCRSYSSRSTAAALEAGTRAAAIRCQSGWIAAAGIAAKWNAKDLCLLASFSANDGEVRPP